MHNQGQVGKAIDVTIGGERNPERFSICCFFSHRTSDQRTGLPGTLATKKLIAFLCLPATTHERSIFALVRKHTYNMYNYVSIIVCIYIYIHNYIYMFVCLRYVVILPHVPVKCT